MSRIKESVPSTLGATGISKPSEDLVAHFGSSLWPTARQGFEKSGRGAVVVEVATLAGKQPGLKDCFRVSYWRDTNIEETRDENLIRKVHDYDPDSEFVVILLNLGP